MARRRLGVALLLPARVADEVNGLRRAVGDGSLERIPPHLTLVPPVNVREEQLPAALAVLRAAAAAAPTSLTVALGPPRTFLPANPVLYLTVGGELEDLHALRDRVFVPPLDRPLTWPFVPHVTLADEGEPAAVQRSAEALDRYSAVVAFERIHLLQEVHRDGRRWEPLADVALGVPAIIGRGGLALELTRSQLVDPEAAALLVHSGHLRGELGELGACPPSQQLVVTARRQDEVVGLAIAWMTPDGGRVTVLVAPHHRRQGIGSHLLAGVEAGVRDAGWDCQQLGAIGPAGFYAARSAYSKRIDE
jgi:2'-5' RNA ligase